MRGGLLILLIKHHFFDVFLSCVLSSNAFASFDNLYQGRLKILFKLYMYAVFKVHLVRGAREACFRGARAFLSRVQRTRCSADFISHQNTQ